MKKTIVVQSKNLKKKRKTLWKSVFIFSESKYSTYIESCVNSIRMINTHWRIHIRMIFSGYNIIKNIYNHPVKKKCFVDNILPTVWACSPHVGNMCGNMWPWHPYQFHILFFFSEYEIYMGKQRKENYYIKSMLF